MRGLQEEIKERVLILDGAMGTMIQQYKLSEDDFRGTEFAGHQCLLKGCNDLLCITKPEVIKDIHRKYLEAGADIIETNTFNANRISMSDYGLEDYVGMMNASAVRIARDLAEVYTEKTPSKPRFVVGSVGPTNKSCSISPDVDNPAARAIDFSELATAYQEQMEVLISEGIDALLIETIFDTLNAKAAIYAARKAMETIGKHVPIMLSVTIMGQSGRTLSGQTLEAFCASVSGYDIFSVGLNCSFGAKQMLPFIKQLSAIASCYVTAYPNAGLPNEFGQYEQTPDDMARDLEEILSGGYVNVVGGCCGTTDAHISKYSSIIGKAKVHKPNVAAGHLVLSGLEVLEVKPEFNFVNIGERCNVAGSRKFLRLIKERNYDEALHIAREQVENGAQILDVNMDDGMLDVKSEMVNFLNLLASDPDIARVPIMVDSSDWDVIMAALRCLQGFDPNILAIGTGIREHDRYALDYLRAVEWIHLHYPQVNISGGVSNLSFAFRGNNFLREAIHAVFLDLAIKKGMTMGIVNPYSKVAYSDLTSEQVGILEDFILCRRENALADVLKLAGTTVADDGLDKTKWRSSSVVDRLIYSLQHGIVDYLDEDLHEALKYYDTPIEIIEGPLMDGMNIVGELFSTGKMFLPQIVKTARTMKRAVEILQPYIEQGKTSSAHSNGRILLATVKGDVHDIGKNIVSVVMACNNFDVIDLGVMVPADDIVKAAIETQADAVGLSGLITPSLSEMVNVVRQMEKAGLRIPVLIGGATTSLKHTAIKIAPEYSGPVAYVKDASQNVPVLKRLLDRATSTSYIDEISETYNKIRASYSSSRPELLSLDEARKKKPDFFKNN